MHWFWLMALALVIVPAALHVTGLVRFRAGWHWSAWVVAGLVLFNGGWMTFDGFRALFIGDYVTPESGPYAGALGPWSMVVEAVGIAPRSTMMKSVFVAYGLTYIGATYAYLIGILKNRVPVVVLAALGLWYLPFGTIINAIVLMLMLSPPLRRSQEASR